MYSIKFSLADIELMVTKYTANYGCSYLNHFTSDIWKFPNFPIVKHSNFIGLPCNDKST